MVQPLVRFEDELVIPSGVDRLEVFRSWLRSDDFPQRGRIDYLDGTIEVDMSPEMLQSHGMLKGRLYTYIHRVVDEADLGQAFVDQARVTAPAARLSCEPDVVFVSWDALETGRVKYVPTSPDKPDRLLEIEGAPDLVVEVISDSSKAKDTRRLPPKYASAGVRELWLADARGELSFRISHNSEGAFRPSAVCEEGFQLSQVLGRWILVRREPGRVAGTWRFFVDERFR